MPALLGAVPGWPIYLVLRALFGTSATLGWIGDPNAARELRLVPQDSPAWWQTALVVVAVGLLGVLVGALASRHVVVSPPGVSRGDVRRRAAGCQRCSSLWGLSSQVRSMSRSSRGGGGQLALMAGIALLVIGVLTAAPWVAYRAGRALARRTSSSSLLLASRWLVMDARAAGRAAAAIGVIALVSGAASAFVANLLLEARTNGHGVDAIYAVPTALVFVVLLVALVVTTFALVVHGVESLTDRRRSLSSLVAEGVPREVIERAVRWEVALAAVPVSVGALGAMGLLGSALLLGDPRALALYAALSAVALGLIWLSLVSATWLVRPWLARAIDPVNLRTT